MQSTQNWTTLSWVGVSRPGSKSNEKVLHIPQRTGASPSDGLVPYLGHSFEGIFTPLQRYNGIFYCPSQLDRTLIIIFLHIHLLLADPNWQEIISGNRSQNIITDQRFIHKSWGSEEYSFIAIAPSSTLAWSGITS